VNNLNQLSSAAPTRIAVLGCGYLGAVHAACLAHWGFDTVGIDTSKEKVELLNAATAPFFEHGLDELLAEGVGSGKLSFTTDPSALASCTVAFICVGTPQLPGSEAADLSQVEAALASVMKHMPPGALVAGKSTVPVGTAAHLAAAATTAGLRLAWNPEFLREGTAVQDTLHPDRIVLGVTDDPDRLVLESVYAEATASGSQLVITDLPTAEVIKQAANAFLATKISFINAVGELCDASGADVVGVSYALGLDDRIGPKFLHPGLGYGGGCFPKDVRALAHRASELGADSLASLLVSTDSTNTRTRTRALELLRTLLARLAGTAGPARVALLGLSFKPGSDDLRDSPALWLADHLAHDGVEVCAYDPAHPAALPGHPRPLTIAPSAIEASHAADLVIVATDWSEFKDLDPDTLVPRTKVLVDLRNICDPQRWSEAGWEVHNLGRPTRRPA
jgi:UDPglucose 6-dehydrogenase